MIKFTSKFVRSTQGRYLAKDTLNQYFYISTISAISTYQGDKDINNSDGL